MPGFSVKDEMDNNGEKQTCEFYMKVGAPWLDPDTDEIEPVMTPAWINMDAVKPNKVSGEGKFQEKLLHGNDLQEAIMEKAHTLAPGEMVELTGLKVYLFRRKTNQSQNHKKQAWKII